MEFTMTARFIAQMANTTPQFKVKTLSIALTLLSATLAMPAYALEAMTDAGMSNATGEGLGFFATNFKLQMPSVTQDGIAPGVLNTFGATQLRPSNGTATVVSTNPGDYGSYLYIGPVGPVPTVSGRPLGNQVDLYLYGLSVSGAGASVNTTDLFTGTGVNLGSASDPFWLQVKNSINNGLDGVSTGVPYVQVAAPTNTATTGNNLHLGAWLNIMQYAAGSATPNYSTSSSTSATAGSFGIGLGPALQVQAIWDGFGINGSVVNLFATPSCSSSSLCPYGTIPSIPQNYTTQGSTTAAPGHGEYQNTLGLSGVLRFNSSRAGTTAATSSMLRLSVQGKSGATNIGLFDPLEGVYLPQLNINLPLGNINYQPLMLTSGVVGGKPTLSLELAQIPNVSSVYNQFYVNYDSNGISTMTGNAAFAGCAASGGTLAGVQCTTNTAYKYLGATAGADPSAITIDTSFVLPIQTGTPGSVNNNSAANYKIGALILNGLAVTGLTPAAGMCVTGTASASAVGCPSTATHGSITIGDAYVNNTLSTQTATYNLLLNDGTSPAGTTQSVTVFIPPGGSDALFTGSAGAPGAAAGAGVNGIYFQNSGGTQVNLGTAAISGLAVNHMKMTLTGL
jgi:hypothetical protein